MTCWDHLMCRLIWAAVKSNFFIDSASVRTSVRGNLLRHFFHKSVRAGVGERMALTQLIPTPAPTRS
jgi:hypothetical protein